MAHDRENAKMTGKYLHCLQIDQLWDESDQFYITLENGNGEGKSVSIQLSSNQVINALTPFVDLVGFGAFPISGKPAPRYLLSRAGKTTVLGSETIELYGTWTDEEMRVRNAAVEMLLALEEVRDSKSVCSHTLEVVNAAIRQAI